jgi:hypothetical protein
MAEAPQQQQRGLPRAGINRSNGAQNSKAMHLAGASTVDQAFVSIGLLQDGRPTRA